MGEPVQKTNIHNVVIAEDHAIVRQGTAQILSSIKDVDIVAEADNSFAAITAVKKLTPDPLVRDAPCQWRAGLRFLPKPGDAVQTQRLCC